MKSAIKHFIPRSIWHALSRTRQRWFPGYARDSFSQEGEDLILERFFDGREAGFYVDVGAHHPKRYSNTYRFYLRGWRGLNIDATPGSMERFRRGRPRDVNVEAAVSSKAEDLIFYVFNDPALNTFDRALALRRSGGIYSIVNEVTIPTRPLWQLLDQYLPRNVAIDFLTVDVEGLDYEVLSSNDWGRFSPEYVLAECAGALALDQVMKEPVAKLLSGRCYSIVAKTMNSVLFRRNP